MDSFEDPILDVDDPMNGERDAEEEGEGDVVLPGADNDSSEEEEEDEDEARRVREGFIVDEDDDEEDEEEKRRRKRRKRKHSRRRDDDDEEEGLEEDDLDLLEENTGASHKRQKNRLTRLRRGRDSESPVASSSRRQNVIESSDEDLDRDENLPSVQDVQRIWDKDDDTDDGELDMDDFIDDSDQEGDEAEKARRRQDRMEKERLRRSRAKPELAGIDALAWDEIHDVFGDGHEFDWALVEEDEGPALDEVGRQDAKFTDVGLSFGHSVAALSNGQVFEPSQIRRLFLSEDDDLVRAQDIPERMQLSTSMLSATVFVAPVIAFGLEDIDDASMWVTQRLSPELLSDYFSANGSKQGLRGSLVAAVSSILKQLFIENVEVPFLYSHRRDLIYHFDSAQMRTGSQLLDLEDLWRIYALGQKYRSLLQRRRDVDDAYARLQVTDAYYEEEIRARRDSVDVVADTSEWLTMKYKDKREESVRFRFHDDEDPEEVVVKHKMPSRISAYEIAKKSVISKLAEGFGIQAHQAVLNFLANDRVHFVDDNDVNPLSYAEQFASPDGSNLLSPEELLSRARMILATELGKDPLLRDQMRKIFQTDSKISVEPTDQGVAKITPSDRFFTFKYLLNKPVAQLKNGGSFLSMLQAEAKNLIVISVTLPPETKAMFERRLTDALSSDSFSETTKAWNEQVSLVVQEVLDQHLLPMGQKWTREYLRQEAQESVARQCAAELREARRIDVAPFTVRDMKDTQPAVVTVSWGKGDPHKDVISVVFLDSRGRLREHTNLDNLTDEAARDEFIDLLRRRKPDVIGVGGFNMLTPKLSARVKEIVRGMHSNELDAMPPVIYPRDDVARLFQHSQRADDEFSSHTTLTKYCVGLARYIQSPVNEYAALGPDIAAITFVPDQHMLSSDTVKTACEQVVIDVVNKIGVDINRAVGDGYYQTLLPFVCGLGPRKSLQLVKAIERQVALVFILQDRSSLSKTFRQGENVSNREQFIKAGLLTKTLFINAAGFLRISQQDEYKPAKYRPDDDHAPDSLDDTRIHPEDYELARKMAMDALEYDEEDVADRHPSWVVEQILEDNDSERKLNELNLDDFAVSLYQENRERKRQTLDLIRQELVRPFVEKRKRYPILNGWQVLTMLSGETPAGLSDGQLVTATVLRVNRSGYIALKLDSGIEGAVDPTHPNNIPGAEPEKGRPMTCAVSKVTADPDNDHFFVDLLTRPLDLSGADLRNYSYDRTYWDHSRHDRDFELLARKKRAEVDKSRRVIKHPNFHNFNAVQAEAYLENQSRGDLVIRPSSKGFNHLAVTWKVDDGLYQHIDVVEPNADPTGQTVSQLLVDGHRNYADLDELIVNHVQAMARRVEELMAHDRYKQGTEDDLHLYLKNALAANPGKSMYGFTLNRKRPGHFSLCFLANKNSVVQTWPVRVTPEAYMLFDAPAVGVPELCDAFKVRHLHESQSQAAGGKTPYGAGSRTPGRAIGGATPGHISVRQPARTPNPYAGGTTPRYGGATPAPIPQTAYGMVPPAGYNGYQTPAQRPGQFPPGQPPLPAGMNPARAAMIQQSSASGAWP
ncbi:unnamed protein product [Mycena citricolor]|uniref:Transcription elongation factor SPT6 n=1 Tax=Mycena citricolor TaxID=2018698 RepID=A0AAD2HMU7_9AGAR|nr:unnamed protein product [Mycena citricolor]